MVLPYVCNKTLIKEIVMEFECRFFVKYDINKEMPKILREIADKIESIERNMGSWPCVLTDIIDKKGNLVGEWQIYEKEEV